MAYFRTETSYDLGFPLGERLWQDIYIFVLSQSRGHFKNTSSSIRIDNSKLLGDKHK